MRPLKDLEFVNMALALKSLPTPAIDASNYLHNIVVFMYIFHDMVVKRFSSIDISTKC